MASSHSACDTREIAPRARPYLLEHFPEKYDETRNPELGSDSIKAGKALIVILLVAAASRLSLAFWPNFHHPDEIFQYLEPAWRMLGHDSIVSWEWRYGIRGWLLPTMMAGPVAIGDEHRVAVRDHDLHLEVANGAPTGLATPSPSGGMGLPGMRERASVLGGSLTAGPEGDGFVVRATLPLVAATVARTAS